MVKGKLGVSLMVGYVLLLSFAIITGTVVYQWLKTYVPQEALQCPDGVSVFIRDSSCEGVGDGTYNLEINISNNGRFSFAGFFIKGTQTEGQELPTWDISSNIISGGPSQGGIVQLNPNLEPGENLENIEFNIPSETYRIGIIPIRYETVDGFQRLASCGQAEVRQDIDCN